MKHIIDQQQLNAILKNVIDKHMYDQIDGIKIRGMSIGFHRIKMSIAYDIVSAKNICIGDIIEIDGRDIVVSNEGSIYNAINIRQDERDASNLIVDFKNKGALK